MGSRFRLQIWRELLLQQAAIHIIIVQNPNSNAYSVLSATVLGVCGIIAALVKAANRRGVREIPN
jgi:hypothetical protein